MAYTEFDGELDGEEPGYVEFSGELDKPSSTLDRAKTVVSQGVNAGLALLTPKRSIADQAQETATLGTRAAPQVKGAPVRQDYYNKMVAEPVENPAPGIVSRVRDTAANDTRAQNNKLAVSKALVSGEPVPEEGGFLASAGRTIGQGIKGAGQLAADLGADRDNPVKQYGQAVIDANPTAVNELGDIAERPGTAVAEATGNAVPSMAGMVGARAVGQGITALSPLAGPAAPIVAAVGQVVSWLGPAAVASLPSYGGIRDKQILNDPANEKSAKAKAVAALGAATVGAIEQSFGPQRWALAAMTKEGREQLARKFAATTLAGSVAKGAVKGAAIEGAEELAQNPIEQLASFDNPTTKENIKDTLFGGAMGAIGGGVLGGGGGMILGKPVTQQSDGVLKYTAERGGKKAKKIAKAELKRREKQGIDPAVANAPETTPEAVERIIATGKDKAADIRDETAKSPDAIQSGIFDEETDGTKSVLQAAKDVAGPDGTVEVRPIEQAMAERGKNSAQLVLPDNTHLPAQWDVVDADSVSASLKQGVNQPRDRSRAASDVQVQGIANNPDYRRLSDSPIMDVGAPTLSVDGAIVGGNGRFEGISRSYDQGSAGNYLADLKADAAAKGIDPARIDGMKKPVLVRRITQPFDTRKLAVASNSGTSLQYSGLELAKIDAERMKGLEALDVTDSGDIALTGSNLQNVRHALGDYSAAELGALTDKDGMLSQEGIRRIRNAMLYSAYGSTPTLERLVESTDNDLRNITGALVKAAGSAAKVRADIQAGALPENLDISADLVSAVETLSKIKSQGQTVDEFLAQIGMFGEEINEQGKYILKVLDTNIRSQRKIADFIKTYYDSVGRIDLSTNDIFGANVPEKQELLKNAKERITDKPPVVQDLFASKPAAKPESTGKPDAQSTKEPANNGGADKSSAKDKQVTPPAASKKEAAPAPKPETQSSEFPGARPLVESLIKRRAAARQGGKNLSAAIDRAKELMEGKRAPSAVEHRYFRLQAKAFERADSEASNILRQISELVNPKQAKGLSVAEVEKHIEPLQKAGTKKIKVAATEADLPKNIQDAIKSAGAAGVRGVYYPQADEVWLVADQLNNADESIMVALHETRHRGLRKLFGDGVAPIMRQIYGTNKRVRVAADRMMQSTKGMSKEEATEEVLADMAIDKTAHDLNGWKRLVQFIQKWLTDHGINLKFTDAMVESLVAGAETVGTSDSQTDTPAFKAWFGNSKVVDSEGNPAIVYHGTSKDIKEFSVGKNGTSATGNVTAVWGSFFTPSAGEASRYTSDFHLEGQNILPVYLSLQKPYEMTRYEWDQHAMKTFRGMPQDEAVAEERAFKAELEAQGYDGIIVKGRGFNAEYIAFNPGQIKSASGNNGNFDASNPDIRFSRAGQNASWDSPEPSKIDNLIYTLQNKYIDLKRVIESIKETGAQLTDQWNTYLQEELFHGRAAKRTKDFVNQELKPIIMGLKLRGQTVEELDKYLHARHAEEANNLIAQRDPNMPDGGSGMTTKEANAYLASIPADKLKALENTARQVDKVIAKTRDTYLSYGLIDQDTADSWKNMFKHYVPLMREDHDGGMGVGQGFSIKGKEAKHRTGSKRKVVDILANIALQRERAIVRGEKNRVAVSLAGLAKLNPNSDFWTFENVPKRHYNEKTGLVEERADPMYKDRPNVVVAKIKDSKGNVQEKAIIFEKSNDRAMRIAAAMKNLDATQLEGLFGVSAMITRYFASINTQYNPVFGVVNLTRDLQSSLLNLSSTPIAGHKAQVMANILPAIRAIYSASRGERKGKQASSPMAVLWDEMQKEGGMTGYRDLFRTSEDRANAIKRELDPTAWMNSKMGKVFTAGGALKVPLAVAQKQAGWLFDWLSDYNQTLEGAMRLSVYKTAIDNGVSKPRAASIAKNISVNFNRKGSAGQQAGALYAFFNAAMQGTARIGETMTTMEKGDPKTFKFNRTGKTIIAGGITLGGMQALALAAAGFDDDEPPEFVRERSLIIPIGDKKYITIPMPLGFHAIPNVGRISTEFALGGFKDPAKHVTRMMGVIAEAFNPIGSSSTFTQTISPTVADPLVALSENKDWTGRPIAKEDFNKLSPTPGFSRNKDTASDPSKWIAEAINTLSGGNKYVPGVYSPTADQIDYLVGQVTGGVGRETGKAQQSIKALYTGEDLPPHKIPLVGRFYGSSASQSSQGNAFYSNLKRINEIEAELKGRRKDKLPLDEFKAENPEWRLVEQANLVQRVVSKQRRHKSDLIKQDAPREQIKAIDEKITKLMTGLNDRVRELKQSQKAAQ